MKRTVAALMIGISFMSLGAIVALSGCGQTEAEKAQAAYDQDIQDLKDAVAELKNPATYSTLTACRQLFRTSRQHLMTP